MSESTYPIILAHGIAPFDRAKKLTSLGSQPDDRFDYFRKIKTTLIEAGYVVSTPNVNIAASVETLATIGTPHNGTPLADWALEQSGIGSKIVDAFQAIGIDLTGFYDLTTKASGARNKSLEPKEKNNGVTYRTWAGCAGFWSIFTPLKLGHLLLKQTYNQPQNDGLVPLESALWKKEHTAGVLRLDRFNQIGWWHPDRLASGDTSRRNFEKSVRTFYLDIASDLGTQEK